MADLIIGAYTFSGSPTNTSNPQRPSTYTRRRKKVGRLHEGMDGSTSWIHRAFKWEWEIGWEKANQTTGTAVLVLRNLTTTLTIVDHAGASFTAIIVGDDGYEEEISTNRANAYLYGLTLVLREA